ncbi:MAG: arginine--tRNA ligase [Candidatus Kerfeldbacteria bacterium]|nr:arginine--tRNA ligase [Candidatus Kerfeldbacteria bacterium]
MKAIIVDKINQAITALQQSHTWPSFVVPEFDVTNPPYRTQGDYASNVAMQLAKLVQRNPIEIGNDLASQLDMVGLDHVQVVSPGFLNIFVNDEFLAGGVRLILEQGDQYGRGKPKHKTILAEFLSANPTGPLHLGNGRGGFTGDVIVRVLRANGYTVIAEYYINDFGNQVEVLAESVLRRYLQHQGIKVDYPDELYRGDYIIDLAKQVQLPDVQLGSQAALAGLRDQIKDWALEKMTSQIKSFVEDTLQIHYDVWKSEKSLHTPANLERAMAFLRDHQLIYEQAGATWFASSRFGDDKDRVIIKQDGSKTYFFSDILYLLDKFEDRNIDHWVWLLGADHHGFKGRMEAALAAIGHRQQMDIIFVQLVRLMFNGKELRMSKRKGTFVTLQELIEEIGLDVARWFFLMYDSNTHMDFDLNLAREQSDKNPVYYVQYAHARICSLLQKVTDHTPASIQLTTAAEEDLAKKLFQFPDVLAQIGENYQVHKLPQYTLDVARAFHKFYSSHRIIQHDGSVERSRLQLVQATQVVLRNALQLMGISAPEKM